MENIRKILWTSFGLGKKKKEILDPLLLEAKNGNKFRAILKDLEQWIHVRSENQKMIITRKHHDCSFSSNPAGIYYSKT